MEQYYEYEEPTVSDVWNNCVVPSLKGVSSKLMDLLMYNIAFNVITQTTVLPNVVFHIISFTLGVILLFSTIAEENMWHFLLFLLLTYVFIYVIHHAHLQRLGLNIEYITGVACIAYLLLCEFYHPNQDNWMQARGLFMVAAMKIISLSFDVQHGLALPSVIEFFGYSCCPANSLFGPWITYSEYVAVQEAPSKKNFKWVVRIIFTIVISMFYLTVSNCWGTHLIPDGTYKWLVAYRQAQSFRTSHYFISYMSEAMMVAGGYNDEKHKSQNEWGYQITNPYDIELPTSLVSVVVSWNVPMHRFLKKYVYRASLQFGHFKAILATYLVSSLLHGFNVEIAAVLLTIGLYSYIQLKFQDKISSELNACLRVRPCKSCSHKYKRNNICVKFAQVVFCFLTIFNLIYLGVLMDSVGYPDSPSVYVKWENLDFLSHWVMLAVHIYTIV